MPRNLYPLRLSDYVVRALYREGLRRRKPMTVVADNHHPPGPRGSAGVWFLAPDFSRTYH